MHELGTCYVCGKQFGGKDNRWQEGDGRQRHEYCKPMAVQSIDEILAERGKTHGDFSEHAYITQAIKAIMYGFNAGVAWDQLSDAHKESLDMIAHKIGRILAGNPNFREHFDDIAGYAKLAADRCKS